MMFAIQQDSVLSECQGEQEDEESQGSLQLAMNISLDSGDNNNNIQEEEK